MVTVDNPLLAPLLVPSLERRREWIALQLSQLGIPSTEQPFTSVITTGCNVFVPPHTLASPILLLVAHYDGDTAHDNAGGVWLTLQILQQFWQSNSLPFTLSALFTDKEETFQQGSSSFLKHHLGSAAPLLKSPKILCIDGFGAGTKITARHHLSPLIHLEHYFRMDADVFREAGFDVWTLHSGLECVQPKRKGQSSEEIADFSFVDRRLHDLKADAIAQFLNILEYVSKRVD
jgi:hypothetical protein